MLTLFLTCQQTAKISATSRRSLLLSGLLAANSLLLSCGQTGPLVLPEKPTDIIEASSPQAPIKKRN